MAYTEAKTEKDGPRFGRKKLHHLRVHPMDGGGHLITHHAVKAPDEPSVDGKPYHEVPYKSHAFGRQEGDMAVSHITEHAKIEMPGSEGGEEEAQMEHEVGKGGKYQHGGKAEEEGED